jgi:hypothetical protein
MKYRIKESQIAGKGENETLEIVTPMEQARSVFVDIRLHVPENGT